MVRDLQHKKTASQHVRTGHGSAQCYLACRQTFLHCAALEGGWSLWLTPKGVAPWGVCHHACQPLRGSLQLPIRKAGVQRSSAFMDGARLLELAGGDGPVDELRAGCLQTDVNFADPNTGDTALHVAASAGNLEACRIIVELGADPLKRNKRNRTPAAQLKLEVEVKDYLSEVEDAAVLARSSKHAGVWNDKIKATQTESALRVGVL